MAIAVNPIARAVPTLVLIQIFASLVYSISIASVKHTVAPCRLLNLVKVLEKISHLRANNCKNNWIAPHVIVARTLLVVTSPPVVWAHWIARRICNTGCNYIIRQEGSWHNLL